MNGGIPERKQVVRTSMCASLNRPRSFVREMWKMRKTAAEISGCVCKDYIVKYSVDPALTDIRGEFPRQAEANLGGNAGCRSLKWGLTAFLFLWAENSTFIRDLDVAKYQWYGAYPALPETEQAS